MSYSSSSTVKLSFALCVSSNFSWDSLSRSPAIICDRIISASGSGENFEIDKLAITHSLSEPSKVISFCFFYPLRHLKEAIAFCNHQPLVCLNVIFKILTDVYGIHVFNVSGRDEGTELYQRFEAALAHEEISHLIIFCYGSDSWRSTSFRCCVDVRFFQHALVPRTP